ncbi:unnamed protein product [Pedinophyceae sp. YPF-701]|nr:unnamed protein product [Pedinophyceae sp. YPF-701]
MGHGAADGHAGVTGGVAEAGQSMQHMHAHGNFTGHFLPGIYMSLWGAYVLFSTLYWSLRRPGRGPMLPMGAWFPANFKVPVIGMSMTLLEPVFLISTTAVSMFGELFNTEHVVPEWRALYDKQTGYTTFDQGDINNYQHLLMYAGFCSAGVAAVAGYAVRCFATASRGPAAVMTPPGDLGVDEEEAGSDCAAARTAELRRMLAEACDYLSHSFLVLAFAIEALLIIFHLKGSDVERRVHELLLITVFVGAVAATCVFRSPQSVAARVVMAWALLTQGTWFVHIGFILYGGVSHWDGPLAAMMLPVELGAHMLVDGLVVATVAAGTMVLRARRAGRRLAEPVSAGHSAKDRQGAKYCALRA